MRYEIGQLDTGSAKLYAVEDGKEILLGHIESWSVETKPEMVWWMGEEHLLRMVRQWTFDLRGATLKIDDRYHEVTLRRI